MASGLEIASVVLGVAPFIIAGIEFYKPGCAAHEIRQLSRVFKTQMTIYRNSLEGILAPLVSDQQMLELLEDSKSDLWRDENLSTKLKEHLGERTYKTFQEIQEDIEEMTAKLHKAFSRIDSKKRLDPRRVGTLAKSFVMRPRNKAGLDRLGERVDQLETMREQRSSFAVTKLNNKAKGTRIQNYTRVRECALRLYDALSFKLTHCGCGTPHHCKLRLEARKASGASDHGSRAESGVQFRFYFSFVDGEVDEDLATGDGSGEADRREIALAWRGIQIQVESILGPAQGPEVESLCECLKTAQRTQPHNELLGYIAAADGVRYTLFNANPKTALDVPIFSCIGSPPTLPSKSTTPQGEYLFQSDQHHLAFTLASTMLQLHDSPWLDKWAKRDIEYIRDLKRDAIKSPIQPYMTRRLSQGERRSQVPTPETYSQVLQFVRNASLFTLGVVLIEIAYNRSIEELAEEDEKKYPDFMSWKTATRLCKQIRAIMGTQYQQAVAGCLYCDFASKPLPEVEFDNEEVRHKFLEQVIIPLEESSGRFT